MEYQTPASQPPRIVSTESVEALKSFPIGRGSIQSETLHSEILKKSNKWSKKKKILVVSSTVFLLSVIVLLVVLLPILLTRKPRNNIEAIVKYNKKDPFYIEVAATSDNKTMDVINGGLAKQFATFSSIPPSQHTTPQIYKFYPQKTRDDYYLHVFTDQKDNYTITISNQTQTLNGSNNQSTKNIKKYDMKASFIVENASTAQNVSILVLGRFLNESNTSKELNETIQALLSNSSYEEEGPVLVMRCIVARIGNIEQCFKPASLNTTMYMFLLQGLSQYVPFLDSKFYDVYAGEDASASQRLSSCNQSYQGQTDIGGEYQKKYGANIVNQDDYYAGMQINSQSNQTKFGNNLETMANKKAVSQMSTTSNVDPETGRILSSLSSGNFQFLPNNSSSVDDSELSFINTFKINCNISLNYIESKDIEDIEMGLYEAFFAREETLEIDDPMNNYSVVFNYSKAPAQNKSNSTALRMLQQNVASYEMELFKQSFLSIDFRGICQLNCYLNDVCTANVIIYAGSYEWDVITESIHIYAVSRLYKCYSSLKIMVLDNIDLLCDKMEEIIKELLPLVMSFVQTASATLGSFKTFLNDIKYTVTSSYQDIKKALQDLMAFSPNVIKTMATDFAQMISLTYGQIAQEMSNEFAEYYNKLQLIALQVKDDVLKFKDNMAKLSSTLKSQILDSIDAIKSNYDTLYSNALAAFSKYGDLVQDWENLPSKFKEILQSNSIFTTPEMLNNLMTLFTSEMTKAQYLISQTQTQLKAAYDNFNTILVNTYNTQKTLLYQDLQTLKDTINNAVQSDDLAQSIVESLKQNSLFLNPTLRNQLFNVAQFTDLLDRLANIIKTSIETVLTRWENVLKTEVAKIKQSFIDIYNTLLDRLLKIFTDLNNVNTGVINDFAAKLAVLMKDLRDALDIIKHMFDMIIDHNYKPTPDQIAEIQKINLFEVPGEITRVMARFLEVKAEFEAEIPKVLAAIQPLDALFSRRRLSSKRSLQQLSGLEDLPSLIENAFSNVLPLNDDIVSLFQKLFNELNLGSFDWSPYKISSIKSQLTSLIKNNFIEKIVNAVKSGFGDFSDLLDFSGDVIDGIKSNFGSCFPPEGRNKLIDTIHLRLEKDIVLASVPLFLGDLNVAVGFVYEHFIDVFWGYYDECEMQFFLELQPRFILGVIVNIYYELWVVRFGAYVQGNIVDGLFPTKVALYFGVKLNKIYTYGLFTVKMHLEFFSLRFAIYIQYVDGISCCFDFTWGDRHELGVDIPSIFKPVEADLYEQKFLDWQLEFFK